MRPSWLFTICIALAVATNVRAQDRTPAPVPLDSVSWRGQGAIQSAVIDGNTQAEGEPFTMLLRLEPGAWIAPHTHNVAKRILVLKGSILFGHGPRQDTTAVTRLSEGSFLLVPAETAHYEGALEPAIIALYGVGPFRTTFIRE